MRDYKYFIDSNIFLRPVVKDDPVKVRECERLFEKISKGEINAFTSNLVLAELIWTGKKVYGIEKTELIKVLRGILDFRNLKIIDDFNSRLALGIYEKYSIKFIDALIASNPKIYKKEAIVVSYDKDFDKIGIKRKKPSQII
jgi:predicted nucleic acid-binding protein